MGIGPGQRCRGGRIGGEIINFAPNPKNFKILEIFENINTYVRVYYPDAKNYEGVKIMVYPGKVANFILTATELDPHFRPSASPPSPIARFAPTPDGHALALKLAKGEL